MNAVPSPWAPMREPTTSMSGPWLSREEVQRELHSWLSDERAFAVRPETMRIGDGFSVRHDEDAGGWRLSAADQPSAARLTSLLDSSAWQGIDKAEDRPIVPERAVLECFYGSPWLAEDRAGLLRAAAAHGATTYVYGPASDARTGAQWRVPYQGQLRTDLAALAAEASSRGMRAVWRVSPGAPLRREHALRIGDPGDLEVLLQRIDEVLDLGFHDVLVAFDDIDLRVEEQTRAHFGQDVHPLAASHAHVFNAVSRHVQRRGARLIACPMHYWGVSPSRYRTRLGELLVEDVPIVWTGPEVISSTVTKDQVEQVANQYGRRLWFWDNYPVNDWDLHGSLHAAQPRRLAVAPVRGRDADLATELAGYGTNATLLPALSQPAVLSGLDWAWGPDWYTADAARQRAASTVGLDTGVLALLADVAGPIAGGSSRVPGDLASSCAQVIIAGAVGDEAAGARESLRDLVSRHEGVVAGLRAAPSRFQLELEPWLVELDHQCALADAALDALDGASNGDAIANGLVARMRRLLAQESWVSIAGSLPRALAETARGYLAGGTPELPE